MTTPVIVLTDAAAPAGAALAYAGQLAKALVVPLRLLHLQATGRRATTQAGYLRQHLRRLARRQPVPTAISQSQACLPDTVAAIMAEQHPLLLIIARPATAAQAEATVSSALDLLHATALPLLLLPDVHRAPPPPHRLVLAASGEPFLLQQGLKTLHALLLMLSAQLTVLHVASGQKGYTSEDALHSVQTCGLAARYFQPDLLEIAAQPTTTGILSGLRQVSADLLVLTVRQRSFWRQLVQRSATARLLEQCPIPVLLLLAQDN